jgi:hypothetical protein
MLIAALSKLIVSGENSVRRTLASLALLALALFFAGCSKNEQGNAPNDNATGTTTYSNSTPPTTTTAAPPGGGATSGGAAPKASPTAPGIKPPTAK